MGPRARWVIAIGYVVFIYATLGVVRGPVNFLRANGLLRYSLAVLTLLCIAVFLWRLATRHGLDLPRFLALAAIAALYLMVARRVQLPEEQIHFFEYGLVGVLFKRALYPRFGDKWIAWGGALLLASVAGVLDEILQGMLPSRHYDAWDIALNIISALLGLALYRIIPRLKNDAINQPN